MNESILLQFIKGNPTVFSKEVFDGFETSVTHSSVKRLLKKLTYEVVLYEQNYISSFKHLCINQFGFTIKTYS